MKFKSLLKAVFSDNVKIFNIKRREKGIKKIFLPMFLFACIIYSFTFYAYQIGESLQPYNFTYLMVALFYILTSILALIQGIYKSQSILFECKDNDLLFSLPIPKKYILSARILKMFTYQVIYSSLFFIPSIIAYGILGKPSLYFYILSLLVLLLIPLIPTVISLIIGYFIKGVSSKFKYKKLIQSILSIFIFSLIYYLSFNIKNFMKAIINNATSIEVVLRRVWYPLSLYINLIKKFNLLDLIILLFISIIPIIIFICIGSKFYFKITFKLKEGSSIITSKPYKNKISNSINSLVRKDLKIFFGSSVYMINACFMLILFLLFIIVLSFKSQEIIDLILKSMKENKIATSDIFNNLSLYYYSALLFVSLTVFINCSTISLEGKNINLIKSLPISEKKYFLSKLLNNNIIVIPVLLIADILFIIKFKINILNITYILLLTIIAPTLTGLLQLLINLMYPKFNYSNDVEVVKQSMSAFISMMITFLLAIGITIIRFTYIETININVYIMLELLVFIILIIILWSILNTYGKKLYNKLNI